MRRRNRVASLSHGSMRDGFDPFNVYARRGKLVDDLGRDVTDKAVSVFGRARVKRMIANPRKAARSLKRGRYLP